MDKTFLKRLMTGPLLLSAAAVIALGSAPAPLRAETTPAEATQAAEEAPQPLSAEELDILVARIALYPDELVALISAASLYPLQVVEAERFLEDLKTKKDLKPKASWDGSIVSLLNYPEIVKMMSDDLEWTQLFGESIVNQQEDVLNAIQQLREQAVANGVIKTDDKVKVTTEVENGRENVIIEPASAEVIYVPQYQPEMLYEPSYAYVPVSYYPDPYPYYWNPGATFFAGAVTGAIWAAAVDWDDGFWGGDWDNNHWHGGGWNGNNNTNIDIDCNKCIIGSDFSGKLNVNDVDWRNVDRSKIKYDKNQFNKVDNTKIRNNLKNTDIKNIDRNKLGSDNKGNFQRPSTLPAKTGGGATKDIRKSTLEGLNKKPTQGFKPTDKVARPGNGDGNLGNASRPNDKMAKPNLDRPVGKPRPGATADNRPKTPSPMGEVTRGRDAKAQSNRGNKSMGGGGISRPQGGGGGNKVGGGGGASKKKFVPKGKGGGGGGRGRR
jgi:uncharacterized membrane protein YgcG